MLTDADIAVLCDIGQSVAFGDEKRDQLARLIVEGYVEKDGDIFKLTAKGESVVVGRGAGLNEA